MFPWGRKRENLYEERVHLMKVDRGEAARIASHWGEVTIENIGERLNYLERQAMSEEMMDKTSLIKKVVFYKYQTPDGAQFDDIESAIVYLKRQEIDRHLISWKALENDSEDDKRHLAELITSPEMQELVTALVDLESRARCAI